MLEFTDDKKAQLHCFQCMNHKLDDKRWKSEWWSLGVVTGSEGRSSAEYSDKGIRKLAGTLKKQLEIPVQVSTRNLVVSCSASEVPASHLQFVEGKRRLSLLTREFLEPTISVFCQER